MRNQLIIDKHNDDLHLYASSDKKSEQIPPKLDFNCETPFKN